LLLTTTVFAVDLALPLGVAAAVPYTFAVLLALRSPAGWFAPAVAGLCTVLTVAKIGLVPERGTTELWKVIANRCLALFSIGMTTFLGVRRRQAEAERAEAEERVREHLADLARMGRITTAGQLATGLAHELNQPLAAIGLQAEIAGTLAAGGAATGEFVPALREVAEQAQRAAEIVRGLWRMVRREEPAPTPVNLGDAVRAVARLVDHTARRAGVEVRQELAPVPDVLGERVQLEQVVYNLLLNAVEATADFAGPRVVTVTTAAGGSDRVTVTVRDTGPGLAPGDESRVFERFFTTKSGGMGMGLAISRAIIESHGGRIGAVAAPGGGAVFMFTLPAAKE
jgi:C4-dicarboxylate-specific signal transduction histidine kinase